METEQAITCEGNLVSFNVVNGCEKVNVPLERVKETKFCNALQTFYDIHYIEVFEKRLYYFGDDDIIIKWISSGVK